MFDAIFAELYELSRVPSATDPSKPYAGKLASVAQVKRVMLHDLPWSLAEDEWERRICLRECALGKPDAKGHQLTCFPVLSVV
jgi:hypothetical protein